jgi:hypothetical protein
MIFVLRKMLTLFGLILLHHARLALSSSSLSMLSLPLLSTDCLSPSPLGGLGPPSPPSPELTPFPSGSRQQPAPMSGTLILLRLLGKMHLTVHNKLTKNLQLTTVILTTIFRSHLNLLDLKWERDPGDPPDPLQVTWTFAKQELNISLSLQTFCLRSSFT